MKKEKDLPRGRWSSVLKTAAVPSAKEGTSLMDMALQLPVPGNTETGFKVFMELQNLKKKRKKMKQHTFLASGQDYICVT